MRRTRIKICGICRNEDALAAAHAGADAVGLVFHRAAGRYVDPLTARQIVAGLPPMVSIVGLFVDADAAHIRRLMDQVQLGAVQLHGHETPELVAQLRPVPVIKALRVDASLGQQLQQWRKAIADLQLTNLVALLMETPSTDAPGGTGVSNDWPLIARHLAAGDFEGLPPIVAAGGLTPENVSQVVRMIRPWAVDVSSGVETQRREKSAEKIADFIRAVRVADSSSGND